MIRNKSDIIIIGSGLIGLITAFCLSKLGFFITIIEKEKVSDSNNLLKDVRTTAISEGTKIILEKFGFWRKIKKFTESEITEPEISSILNIFLFLAKINLFSYHLQAPSLRHH